MSFPRAPLKRFNEHVGCAPPPGTYDVKSGEVKGAASFHKAERFKTGKGVTQSPSRKDAVMSPMRRTMSADVITEGLSQKKKSNASLHLKHQKLLEKEIRSLLQQRGEQDRRLRSLEEEVRKLEAKLTAAQREKTGLSASMASLERQLGELGKANEFLKSKVSGDATKRRINALLLEVIDVKNKLDAKDKELSILKINSDGEVKVLDAELQASRHLLGTFEERNKDLESLYGETKSQNQELENEMEKQHVAIQELREEVKALQAYLDAANEDVQSLRLKLREIDAMSENQAEFTEVEKQLEERTAELLQSKLELRVKEQALEKSSKDLQQAREASRESEEHLEKRSCELKDAQNAVGQQELELSRLRDVLRRTEDELDERVALMKERCLVLEEERAKTQEEGLRRIEQLKAEISSLVERGRNEEKAYKHLHEEHSCLLKQLEEEKVKSSSLTTLMEQLEGELEEALVELSELEAQEQRNGEELQRLEQENHQMEKELETVQTELQGRNAEVEDQAALQQVAMKSLQEEHDTALGKIEDLVTELESTKARLASEIQLSEELRQVSQKLEEKHQQLLVKDQSRVEAKEKIERMLQDAQATMAQMNEEMKAAAQSHAAETKRYEEEMQRMSKVKKELEVQLESRAQRESLHEKRDAEVKWLQERLAQAEGEKVVLQERLEQDVQKLKEQMRQEKLEPPSVPVAEKSAAAQEQDNTLRQNYEELYAKVKPFQELLDQFAVERSALLCENNATQEELSRLADAYAHLLGHQNQRQKIKHVVKLKEENFSLKQEVAKLRAQVAKQKKDLEQLKSTHAPRKFDPSKAFRQNSKENQHPNGQGNQAF